jgi:predicted aspartyl protease
MTIELNENHFVEFERKYDHLMVWAHPFANESPKAPSKSPVEFILDSGAMITMIDLGTAEELKYTSLPVKRSTTLGGVVPGCSIAVDYKVIEGIKIAGLRLSKVTVAIPDPNDDNSLKFERSILGQNILEYFNYFMDTGNDKIYFAKNPNPKPISEDAKCGVVFTVGE